MICYISSLITPIRLIVFLNNTAWWIWAVNATEFKIYDSKWFPMVDVIVADTRTQGGKQGLYHHTQGFRQN